MDPIRCRTLFLSDVHLGARGRQAEALTGLNLGTATEELTTETIESWLRSPALTPRDYPDVSGEIVRWIDSGRWDDGVSLARSLWAGY